MTYQYDQLNRLTATISHSWDKAAGSFAANNLYNSQYTYDANGNISTLKRNAPKSATILEPTPMDDLTYSYYNKNAGYSRHTNRLSSVTDAITEALYDDEFTAGQAANNYSYDATGNLLADAHEEIEEIRWNVQGKVVYLKRTESSNKPDIEFEYDAMGNRIAKHVKPKNSATHSTYYVRDAQGNTMATYSNSTETITLEEQPIYGSSRIGVYSPTADTGIVRGLRTYEATNHLGNVLTTYTDRIILSEDFTYTPEQTTATDYYPFGMPMPGRSFSMGNYRYGFGSHEKDDEIFGSGNYYGFGDYGLDVRLGRRWRPDPEGKMFPYLSSYSAFGNNPILYKDVNGDIIRIYYTDENGNSQYFDYKSNIEVPNNEYVQQTVQVLDKLISDPKNLKDAFGLIIQLKNMPNHIVEIHYNDNFCHTGFSVNEKGVGKIDWNPNIYSALLDEAGSFTGEFQSSTTILAHELYHMKQYLDYGGSLFNEKAKPIANYQYFSIIEYETLTTIETNVAKYFGEGVRTNYSGFGIRPPIIDINVEGEVQLDNNLIQNSNESSFTNWDVDF